MAAALRGEETGIACSNVPVGGEVNADNIAQCIQFLKEIDWNGVVSIECYGSEKNTTASKKFLTDLIG